ncbi:hypothetical protein J6E39_01700 [bacterium]|nr:hypothetical protein [bacterium]
MQEIYKKTILVDLDGVLSDYKGNYDKKYIPPIRKGAKNFLEELSKTYEIKIFTSRSLKITTEWLIDNKLNQIISDVTNIKVPAHLIIDDRAICHNGNFEKTIKDIKSFEVYWKLS